jgi:hypothetical protein
MEQIMSSGRCKRLISRTLAAAIVSIGLTASAAPAFADPPDRVARISVISGAVSFRPASTDEWDTASPNYPLTIGDHVWTDRNARTEIDLGDAAVRLGPQTDVGILNLEDRTIQLRVTSGVVNIHLREGWQDVFELDTPNGAISMTRPGTFRVDVNPNGDASTITVRRGDASVQAGGYAYPVRAQESMELAGFDSPHTQLRDAIPTDAFEDWCIARDRREDTTVAASYVPNDVVGYSDLDDYGSWSTVAEYGPVWTPRVRADWVPYHDGRWVWIDPWGWTWVDAEPWGFAPFHYGRWVSLRSGWGWVPGRFVERPVYAPALVAFVGGGGWGASFAIGSEPVGWFPLGPREPYIPAYRVSSAYVHRINVPHVNVTNVNVTNITYVNRNVPGAVTAVPRDAFLRSRPVAGAAVAVPREAARTGQIVGHAAPIAPQPGAGRDSRQRGLAPPAAIVNRPVVVHRQPPPAAGITGPAAAQSQGQVERSQVQQPRGRPQTAPQVQQPAPQPQPQAGPRARPREAQPQSAPPAQEPVRARPREQAQPAQPPPQQPAQQQPPPPPQRAAPRQQPPPPQQPPQAAPRQQPPSQQPAQQPPQAAPQPQPRQEPPRARPREPQPQPAPKPQQDQPRSRTQEQPQRQQPPPQQREQPKDQNQRPERPTSRRPPPDGK